MTNGKLKRVKNPANLVGPQIRRLRVERGWSQAKFAMQLQLKGLDICRDVIAQMEGQAHTIRDKDIPYFARALGVGIPNLFSFLEERNLFLYASPKKL